MLFYRIEDKFGDGMYTTGQSEVAENMFELSGRHPGPRDEEGLQEYRDSKSEYEWENHRYAFKSIEQLKSWVYKKEWWVKLKEDGLNLIIIKADGFHGDTQAVFDKSTMEVVGHLDLRLI